MKFTTIKNLFRLVKNYPGSKLPGYPTAAHLHSPNIAYLYDDLIRSAHG